MTKLELLYAQKSKKFDVARHFRPRVKVFVAR